MKNIRNLLTGIIFFGMMHTRMIGLSQVRLTISINRRSVTVPLVSKETAFFAAGAAAITYSAYKIAQTKNMQRIYREKLKTQQMLLVACRQGNQALFEQALQAGADINEPFSDGQTILMKAAIADRLWLVQRLMFLCVDSVSKDANGKRAIDYALAASDQNQEIIRLINHRTTKMLWEAMLYRTAVDMQEAIDAGADINEKDSGGYTILMNALLNFYHENAREKIRALVHAGASVLAENHQGQSVDEIISENFSSAQAEEILQFVAQVIKEKQINTKTMGLK